MSNFLDLNFSQEDLSNSTKDDFEIIPKGEYIAEITRSEIKDFHWQKSSGAVGKSLSLMFKILEGEYAGRVLWDNPQLSNSEFESFVVNGRKKLAQIAAAVGITQLNDSTQLHDKELIIQVGIEVDKSGQYDDKNVIRKVLPAKGGSKFTAKPQVPSAPKAPTKPQAPQAAPEEAPTEPSESRAGDDTTPAWQRG